MKKAILAQAFYDYGSFGCCSSTASMPAPYGGALTACAVIGCGYWGKNLVRNFSALGALAMVCDPTPTGQATARALAPQAEVVPSLEAALRTAVAGVVIATPAETHYELVKQALEAGKDV